MDDRAVDFSVMSDEDFRAELARILAASHAERRENQLLYYKPVSASAMAVHESRARVVGVGGGNGSAKTDTALVEVIACATGIFPHSLAHLARSKFRGPINCRVVVQSITTTLYPIILPKLQYWKWSGVSTPGGEKGHWGWVPRWCLKAESWEKSWRDSIRQLTVLCRDPEEPRRVLGESTIQFMAHGQESVDAASGDFHIIHLDEPPSLAMYRESEARTMRVNGRIFLTMTWPDDPSIAVDWLFDEIYEPGMRRERDIEWYDLYTTDNPNLNQDAVSATAAGWSTEMKQVRLFGQPIRFSNRVHPLFDERTQHWCFGCGTTVLFKDNPQAKGIEDRWLCESCGSPHVCEFNHVREFNASDRWPAVFVIDPHPRKPHMFLWAMVDPSDDLWIVADGKESGDCPDTRRTVEGIERDLGLQVATRLIDPNMGRSLSRSNRETTWQDDFAAAGLATTLADDGEAGRRALDNYFKPDIGRWQPRIHIHPRCRDTIFQLKRYVWGDYRNASDRGQKQVPKDKDDDYPSMLKYLANFDPTFRRLHGGWQAVRRPGAPGARNLSPRVIGNTLIR